MGDMTGPRCERLRRGGEESMCVWSRVGKAGARCENDRGNSVKSMYTQSRRNGKTSKRVTEKTDRAKPERARLLRKSEDPDCA